MAKPDPFTGLVIRYDYLWDSRKRKGHQVGELRPCAVVFVAPNDRIIVCGITHTDPGDDTIRVELDELHKEVLGLDDDPQWIDCSEVNEISWTDPGIEPTPWGDWTYGQLGEDEAQEMLDKVRAQLAANQLKWIERDPE